MGSTVKTAPKITLKTLFAAKMKSWGIKLKDQGFHYRTERFTDAFPVEANMNEAQLAHQLWWWRCAVPERCNEIFSIRVGEFMPRFLLNVFRDHLEESAFFYEIRARYRERYIWDFGCPWIRCTTEQQRFLNSMLPNHYPAQYFLPSNVNDKNWVEISGLYNLDLSDETISRLFMEKLREVRKRAGIERPGKGLGTRRKGISWKPIELMDAKRYGATLGDSERSQISKALREYVMTCDNLGLEP